MGLKFVTKITALAIFTLTLQSRFIGNKTYTQKSVALQVVYSEALWSVLQTRFVRAPKLSRACSEGLRSNHPPQWLLSRYADIFP